jgi:hypothetical protein
MENYNYPYSSPEYFYSNEDIEDSGIHISYNDDEVFIIDIEDHISILNSRKKFILNEDIKYPYYTTNGKKITIVEFIYKFDFTTTNYEFKNGDVDNLKRNNVKIYHKYNDIIKKTYHDAEYIQGHYNRNGIDAFILKNPLWKIVENNKEYLLMYCEKDTICKLCIDSYNKILDFEKEKNNNQKITWHKCENGYIAGKNKNKQLYIHQIITNYYGNGQGTAKFSIDHIDRDKLNNTIENLRIATREEQEQNSTGICPGTKRQRQKNARLLPEGMSQDMLKKYVVYYYNVYDKKNNKAREYFSVEQHPKLNKRWETSKSNEVSIFDKLNQANKVIEDLENDIFPKSFTEQRELPKSVSIINKNDLVFLSFDRRDEKRMNYKMKLPNDYILNNELNTFLNNIRIKYNNPDFVF